MDLTTIKRDIERGGDHTQWPTAAVRELVAEIEQLREENARLRVAFNVWADHADALRAELDDRQP